MFHLLAGALLLAFSLLAVLPPQHSVLWMPSILAKEWGWVYGPFGRIATWATERFLREVTR